jgi:hypothetical protein
MHRTQMIENKKKNPKEKEKRKLSSWIAVWI